jgi:hypothetical protein
MHIHTKHTHMHTTHTTYVYTYTQTYTHVTTSSKHTQTHTEHTQHTHTHTQQSLCCYVLQPYAFVGGVVRYVVPKRLLLLINVGSGCSLPA